MTINDVKTLTEVAEIYNIHVQTLHSRIRINELIEGVDYRSIGERRMILLSPSGIEKITKGKRTK
jgi:AICAR transformylase/IMP cyclohydrolase PurH